MARKRYITTDISLSGKVEKLARNAGEYAVILWTWMIPHLDDWGRMEGEADKVFFAVTPRFALLGKTPDDAEKALQAMTELGLIQRYEVNGQLFIQVNTDTFYELQTYIPKAKREEDKSAYPAPPAESQQVALSSTECNSALLSVPSPFSLHPTPSPSPSGNTHACPSPPDTDCVSSSDEDEGANEKQEGVSDNGQQQGPGKKAATKVKSLREEYSADFEAFWKAYPRKKEKRRAWRVWKTRIRERVAPADLIQAATNYAATCRGKEERYVKLAATFLGPDRPYEEYLKGVDGDGPTSPAEKDYTFRFEPEPERDYTRGLPGY